MIKKLCFLILLTLTTFSKAQSKRIIFYGKIVDSIGALANVHVINLYTNQGTFTNDEGKFRIFAKEKDSLQFSFVGYQTQKIKLESTNFGLSKNEFLLQKQTEELDEVVLKKNTLTGNLALDIKKVPKDPMDEMMTSLMDGIINMDFSIPQIEEIDEIDRGKAPIVNTNPMTTGATLFTGSIFTSKKKVAQLQKLDKIKQKERFYKKLFAEVDMKYFTSELNIPENNIYHFINYCGVHKINKLISEKNVLTLLKLFEEQSVAYLQTIKQ